ncbi:MAG TPA: Crp/Fnr family transcriptional regulator [bacterium]|nr:Crp/Fnr family transcriptional regulator [bacterium]
MTELLKGRSFFPVRRKQVLFHEGHPALGVYYLEAGRAKVYKTGCNGRPYILFFAGSAELLNAECILESGEFATSAEMLEDGRVVFIERERLLSLVGDSLPLSLFIAGELARRTTSSYEERVRLADGRVRERMARALALLGSDYGRDEADGRSISLRLSRDELASMIGTTPATVMRLLRDFKDEGAILLAGRRIVVSNMEYLEKVGQI